MLKRIQSKPKAVRAQYAFFISLGITGIIAFIWVTTLPVRFAESLQFDIDGIRKDTASLKEAFPDTPDLDLLIEEENTFRTTNLNALGTKSSSTEDQVTTSTKKETKPAQKVILIATTTAQTGE